MNAWINPSAESRGHQLSAQANAQDRLACSQPLADAGDLVLQKWIIPLVVDSDRAAKHDKEIARLRLRQRKANCAYFNTLDGEAALTQRGIECTQVLECDMTQNQSTLAPVYHVGIVDCSIAAARVYRIYVIRHCVSGDLGLLVADSGQQPLNFCLLSGRDCQQRRTGAASVVAVEVAGILDAADAQLADDSLAGAGDALLLLCRQLQVVVFPGKIDLLAGLWGAGGKPQDGSGRAGFQGFEQPRRRTGEHLKAHFLGPRLDGSDGRRRRQGRSEEHTSE